MYADYEADMSYYDYYEACPMCAERSVFKGSGPCEECTNGERDLELLDYADTKSQRREARRSKARLGMVKHSTGSERAPKMPSPRIRVNGKDWN